MRTGTSVELMPGPLWSLLPSVLTLAVRPQAVRELLAFLSPAKRPYYLRNFRDGCRSFGELAMTLPAALRKFKHALVSRDELERLVRARRL